MEVITVESKVWKSLNERLENIEKMLFSIKESPAAPPIRSSGGGFMAIEEVMAKYKISRTTINNKYKLFGIRRLSSGRYNLIHEEDLIEALKRAVPKPEYFRKK